MKGLLLCICAICWIVPSHGQTSELLGTWYLDHLLLGDVGIHPEVGTSPFILFEDSNATYQISGNGGCNDFAGTLEYDINDETYLINSFEASPNVCSSNVNQFENVFFNFFMIVAEVYSYDVFVDTGGEEVLHIQFFPIGDTAEFRRTPPLSISENDTFNPAVAPNPVQDMLHISSEMSQIETLAIYDVSGSTVLHSRAFNGALDVSALSNGIYFLEIRSTKDRSIQKFIKK